MLALLVFVQVAQADCALIDSDLSYALFNVREPDLKNYAYATKYDSSMGRFDAPQKISQIAADENIGGYGDFDRDGYYDVLTYTYELIPGTNPSPSPTPTPDIFYDGKAILTIYVYYGDRVPAICLTKTTSLDHFAFDNVKVRPGHEDTFHLNLGTADLTGDGLSDVVINLQGTDEAFFTKSFHMLQTSPRTFALPAVGIGDYVDLDPGGSTLTELQSSVVTLGDYTGDGQPDQLILDYHREVCAPFNVYLARGIPVSPFFQLETSPLAFQTPSDVLAIFNSGDSNGDGKLDIMYGLDDDGDSGQLWSRFGNGDGTFSTPDTEVFDIDPVHESNPSPLCQSGEINWGDAKAFMAMRDFNGDGYDDIVLCQYQTLKDLFYIPAIPGLPGQPPTYDWNSRQLIADNMCSKLVVAGPGFTCRQEKQTCTTSVDCCQLSDGYFQNQWCSFDGTGRCCAFGFHYDASAADCVADLPVNTPVPYSPQDIPANLIELSCPVLAPTERTEFRLECVHDTQPCAPLVDPNPPFLSYPNVNANFIRRDGSYYYYEIYALQDGPYVINAEYPGVGKTSCTINRISTSAALTVPDLPLFLIPLLLLAAGLFIRRKNRRL